MISDLPLESLRYLLEGWNSASNGGSGRAGSTSKQEIEQMKAMLEGIR